MSIAKGLQALVDAQHDANEFPGTFLSTTGLIFFGTPFRGAEGMRQVDMLAAARQEYQDDKVQTNILRILEPGNEFLQDLDDQFGKTRRQASKAEVACFYELKSSNVGRIVGNADCTVRYIMDCAFCARLTIVAEVGGKQELWLPRPIRCNEQVLALTDPFQHEQIRKADGGRL